jgi:uncharacterized protein (DUF849 family)
MEFLRIKPVGIVAIFIITGWMLKTYLTHREKMKELALMQKNIASSDQRLARVEQAVESIAIEVERISEGQRFVTKLLSDPKTGRGAVVPVSGLDTPH